MASRKCSKELYVSPHRAKIPDVFVIQDYSTSPPASSGIQGHLSPSYGGYLSPDCNSSVYTRSNSTVSSIFDLSFESEQLDRSLRANDAFAVSKILQVHYGKFPTNFRSQSPWDRHSVDTRGRRPSSRSQDQDVYFRKQQPAFLGDAFDRRESVTPEWDIPDIFRTSFHVAILHNSLEVIEVLLKHGIDPNEPRSYLANTERRLSSYLSDVNKLRPDCVIEESFEQCNSEESLVNRTSSDNLTLTVPVQITPPAPPIETNRKQSTASHDTTKPRASFAISLDNEICYTTEELFNLPPLFIAIQEKRDIAVIFLLQYGADPNVHDRAGNTPLHLAATDSCYDVNICTVLLRNGARTRQSNKHGQTPLDIRQGLCDMQIGVVKDMLSGKGSSISLDKCLEANRQGKRISLSSSADSGSRNTSRSGSIKKRFFKRSELRDKEKVTRERRRLESTSTGTDIFSEHSNASSHRSNCSRSRIQSMAVTEDMDSEAFLASGAKGKSIYRGRAYQCKKCFKVDRKGRTVAHILKHHVPFDRVPFSCSLCNFRCQDKATLVKHITQYRRHQEEVQKAGGRVDHSRVLSRSDNPRYVCDDDMHLLSREDSERRFTRTEDPLDDLDGIFEDDDEEFDGLSLPDWAKDIVVTSAPSVPFVPAPFPGLRPFVTPFPSEHSSLLGTSPRLHQSLQHQVLLTPPPLLYSSAGTQFSTATSTVPSLNVMSNGIGTSQPARSLTLPTICLQDIYQTGTGPLTTNSSLGQFRVSNSTVTNQMREGTPLMDERINTSPSLEDLITVASDNDPLVQEIEANRKGTEANRNGEKRGNEGPEANNKRAKVEDSGNSKRPTTDMSPVVNAIEKASKVIADALDQNTRAIRCQEQTLFKVVTGLERMERLMERKHDTRRSPNRDTRRERDQGKENVKPNVKSSVSKVSSSKK